MIAKLIDLPGRTELHVDGKLFCAFSDRSRAEKVLERYRVYSRGVASLPFVRIVQKPRAV